MFEFLKKIFRKREKSSVEEPCCSKTYPKWFEKRTVSPPPDYDQVILERVEEIRYLEKEIKILERKQQHYMKRYLYAESLCINASQELEQLNRSRKEKVCLAVRRGHSIPPSDGYKLCYKLMREKLEFLEEKRDNIKQQFLFKHADLLRCRARKKSLKARLLADMSM